MALPALLLTLATATLAPSEDLAALAAPRPFAYAELPDGFAETVVARGLTGATAMAVAADGRVFICEQTGAVRIVKSGRLLEAPFVRLAVDSSWERGLIGIALAPGFPGTPHVYLCYVAAEPYPHHRVSRFTARGDVAVDGSEVILLQGDDQRKLGGAIPAGHQGGPIAFGPDGKLYVCVGEQTACEPSQRLDTFQGKLLRICADGSIPEDNPFFRSSKGKYRAVWALGLRNPFGLAFQPGTGRMFVTDVGGSRYEEINEGRAGANYGWPIVEGPSARKEFVAPIHAYDRSVGRCVTAGVFYDRVTECFPDRYKGKFFFCDYIDNWIRALDPGNPTQSEVFARGLRGPVDLRVAPDGSLYLLNRNVWVKDGKFRTDTGSLHRIAWAAREPSLPRVTRQPKDAVVAAGEKVTLRVEAGGSGPRAYQWEKDGRALAGETLASLQVKAAGKAGYRCLVTSAHGGTRSREALVRALPLLPAVSVEGTRPGLECASYEVGDLYEVPRRRVRPQVVTRIDASPRTRDEDFSLEFSGLLSVPADGVYTFAPHGGRTTLWMDHRRVDGAIGLRKGMHWLRLIAVHDKGKPELSLLWSGPGFGPEEVMGFWHPRRGTPVNTAGPPTPWSLQVPPSPDALPSLLSRTGVFHSLKDLKPAPGVVPYDVNSPLWSDGASKRRWVALQSAEKIRFRPRGEWAFPAGTVFVKHFELPGGAGKARRLETRLLVADGEGSGYGVTYRWRPDGRDADLLHDGRTEKLEGAGRTWHFPSRGDCLVCHNRAAGFVLGVNARQLNRGDQLAAWCRDGLLDVPLSPRDIEALPRSRGLSDAGPVEERVRSYLDTNCAFCHRPGGSPGPFDLRYDTWSRDKLLKAPLVAADLGLPGVRLVTPGAPERSMLYLRMKRREDVFNMPPLASAHADEAALAAVAEWIRAMK